MLAMLHLPKSAAQLGEVPGPPHLGSRDASLCVCRRDRLHEQLAVFVASGKEQPDIGERNYLQSGSFIV
jgi:hypothetical protein